MEFTGTVKEITNDYLTGELHITFSINEKNILPEYEKIKNCKKLRIEVKIIGRYGPRCQCLRLGCNV
jgi:hypothetical protein